MQSADPARDVSAFSHSHADGAVIGSKPGVHRIARGPPLTF